MKITRPYDNEIIVVEDFLSQSEVSVAKFFVDNLATEEDWNRANSEVAEHLWGKTINLNSGLKEQPLGIRPVYSLAMSINKKIDNLLTELGILFPGRSQLGFNQIIRVSDYGMDAHSDDAKNSEFPIFYGLVIYLNDDFYGGSLQYPNLGINHSPVPKSLVIHPATDEYMHLVTEVTDGVRYSMTSFVVGDTPRQ